MKLTSLIPPRRWLLPGCYVLLLLASHLWRQYYPLSAAPAAGQASMMLRQNDGRMVTVNYLDLPASRRNNAPVALLLHGSPAAVEMFDDFLPDLSRNLRIIAPDLPGYGTSSRNLPDYSIATHARLMVQLLDSLHIDSLHVIGYSQGGGVAIHLTEMLGKRMKSLIMLAGIGVIELELLGDYKLNHAVHGVQLAALWLLQEGTPHFGMLDRFLLNTWYARNFYHSDQRPLRDLLLRTEQPTLLLHGRNDGLVPYAAALEHHRLLPQSRLLTINGGHGMVMSRTRELSDAIEAFTDSIETGNGVYRRDASPQRTALALVPFNGSSAPPAQGIALLVLFLIIALGTLLSEDLACIAAGLLASRGVMSLFAAVSASFAGIVAGDIMLFYAGRFLGRGALRRAPLKWLISPEAVAKSEAWFRASGPRIILASRFLPGTRLATYFSAGMLGASFRVFLIWFGISAAVWTPLLVGLAAWIGEPLLEMFAAYRQYALPMALAALLLLRFLMQTVPLLFSHTGRRLLYSRWLRLTRWEFWPPYIFYLPLTPWLLWLALRHRSATLFTAANPAMPAGGFAGESKSDILTALAASSQRVAPFGLIEGNLTPEQQLAQLRDFQVKHGDAWPVVFKPDIGERGRGVQFISGAKQAEEVLRQNTVNLIVQTYIPGNEYGLFYYRYPGEEQGHILSITDKRMIGVTGDGKRSLEQLILADERAVCMADFHLKQQRQRLYSVPAAGEKIALTQLGTHCRGALFLDGASLQTPALLAAIDTISKGYKGFYFGRYDLRVPSAQHLQRAEEIWIIELNGVTSEATHIYDPQHGLRAAYRVLRAQWHIAFAIGRQNRDRGTRVTGIRELIGIIVAARRDATE